MKAKLIGLMILIVVNTSIFAQNQDFAMIYIYRSQTFLGLEYNILFNNVKVHTMPMDSRTFFSYKIYSEGKLEIDMGGYKINLEIENGKSYYITNWKLVPNEKGQKEFNKYIDSRPHNYTKMEEDRNYPIIRNDKNLNKSNIALENRQIDDKKAYIKSDIDLNIPESTKKYENKYALIIGNEDYSSYQQGLNAESNVDFAANDAQTVKEYVKNTLGIPDENIIYLENAKAVEMSRAIKTLSVIIKNSNGKADVLFYYAGHGFPDEKTNEPYLVPVDVSGTDLQFAVKLTDLYTVLSEYPSQKVTLILDACFSGGSRNQGLVAARGVKVKPKDNILTGNMVVLTASSGEQSSLSYKEKNHGIFTYYLLKKIQETKGDITYKELSEYLNEQVPIKSALINQKEQNPQTLISINVKDIWENWRIK